MPTLFLRHTPGAENQIDFFELKFKRINATLIGQTELIPLVTGKKILVIGYLMTAALAVVVDFNDDSGTLLGGPFDLGVLGQVNYPGSLYGPAFETGVGRALRVNLSLAVNVRGHITYAEVD
jgi:hypothetical protein